MRAVLDTNVLISGVIATGRGSSNDNSSGSDTNVLISGVIATGVPHKLLVKGFNHEYQIVVSVETLTEFRKSLLTYPERFHMDEKEIQEEVETILPSSLLLKKTSQLLKMTPTTTNSSKQQWLATSIISSLVMGIYSRWTRSVGSRSSNREPSTTSLMSNDPL